MQISPSHLSLRSSLKCCLKLSRILYPSEGGQNKTPGNLVRVLGWHGRSFWGQVCLLSGPVEGNCLWLSAQPSARQRQIVWTPVFSFPNCCTSTHQSHRHISYQSKRSLLWQIWECLVYKLSVMLISVMFDLIGRCTVWISNIQDRHWKATITYFNGFITLITW